MIPEVDTTFMAAAACRGLDPDLFHPERGQSLKPAKAVCAGCPVVEACLEYALVTFQKHGVWGGKSEQERRRIRVKRRQAGELAQVCQNPACATTFVQAYEQQRYHSEACRDEARRARIRNRAAA